MYIDTHTHIYADVFEKEHFQAVQRALDNKVEDFYYLILILKVSPKS